MRYGPSSFHSIVDTSELLRSRAVSWDEWEHLRERGVEAVVVQTRSHVDAQHILKAGEHSARRRLLHGLAE